LREALSRSVKQWRGNEAYEYQLKKRPSTSTPSAGESTAAVKADAYAAFALVHGLAGIWLSGALPHPEDHESLAREITHRLRLTQFSIDTVTG